MRVICLVPSLTETLIECGVDVVGRTRFCVHPRNKVDAISIVGGTKNVDWTRCEALQPDLVIFDKEENRKDMAESCPFAWHATHVRSIYNIGTELRALAHKIDNAMLFNLADEWDEVSSRPSVDQVDWSNVPGQISALNNSGHHYQRVEYMIWRKPWMAVNAKTFIGSMLEKIGFADLLAEHSELYPQIDAEQVGDADTFYLFSSEPYPFAKDKQDLIDKKFNGAIVDGELYSWFGVRSLRALSSHLSPS